ncbi:hypothetical protein [Kitasatospora purpeofusca]|uniref:hypothetical protein n=1 Tax=Kitasatospora purpeofusca TaxID=67352 RepID=UPI002A5A3EEC|nr:hypothetical protein [Kitasatospora purpeofusca]MDY0814799.1 hypothetical protein [Kitasatospora purpeofusca]
MDGAGGVLRGGVQACFQGDRVADEVALADRDPAVAAVEAPLDPADLVALTEDQQDVRLDRPAG